MLPKNAVDQVSLRNEKNDTDTDQNPRGSLPSLDAYSESSGRSSQKPRPNSNSKRAAREERYEERSQQKQFTHRQPSKAAQEPARQETTARTAT